LAGTLLLLCPLLLLLLLLLLWLVQDFRSVCQQRDGLKQRAIDMLQRLSQQQQQR
jgi:hypothetical protein